MSLFTHIRRTSLAAALVLVAAACAEEVPTEGAATDDASADGAQELDGLPAGEDVAATDAAPSTDVAGPGDAPPAADVTAAPDGGGDGTAADAVDATKPPDCKASGGGPAGCPCAANEQCTPSLACIDTAKGPRCAKLATEGCSSDEKQVPFGTGADTTNICVPKAPKLCNPCTENQACQSTGYSDAKCIEGGDSGSFCGVTCVANEDCLAGYECKLVKDVTGAEAKQCVVKSGGQCTCSEYAIVQKYSTKCSKVDASGGKCQGKRTCLAAGEPGAPSNGGLTSCVAEDPKTESCNGVDDDCDGTIDEGTCDDKNVCTDDVCDPKAGCKYTNKTSPCDNDGSVCTQDDKCIDGKCTAGAILVCNDKNECTKDSCDKVKGCLYENDNAAPCDADQNECTLKDTCKDGVCKAGAKKACESGDDCISGACSPLDGKCLYKAKDGDACNDANPCTIKDECVKESATTAACAGAKIDCDDKNACTSDSCDKVKGGCAYQNIGGACTDNDQCTENDVCLDGSCKGKGIDIAKVCDDGNPCTQDKCKADAKCVNPVLDSGTCDDGNICTSGDSCTNGVCKPGTNTCACTLDSQCKDDGNLCNGVLKCVKNNCELDQASVVKCADSTSCTKIDCVPGSGKCVPLKQPDGLPCDADKNACTQNDKCADGGCTVGTLLKCDDENPCTTDTCDATKGCIYTNNTDPCNADDNACTQADKCDTGSCQAGKKKACDDGEACTKDDCDAKTAECKYLELKQSCDDGNACTEGDACGVEVKLNKYTCLGGKGPDCNDNNPCTVDTCALATGCKSTIDAKIKVPCYSGDPKTANKGVCKDGAQQCDALGKLGTCTGEVKPDPKEGCDGVDNTCDGTTDEGCAPTGFQMRFSNAVVTGAGPKFAARVSAGASNVAGAADGTGKYSAYYGFYAWLKKVAGL